MWNPKTECFQCKSKLTNPVKIVFFNGFEETTIKFCSFDCIRKHLIGKSETQNFQKENFGTIVHA